MPKIIMESIWGDSPVAYRWERMIGRINIRYSRRPKSNLMGRFGGGWNWKLGAQWSARKIIFNLLIAELSFSIIPKNVGSSDGR